jgi:hypothetical protein
LALLEMLLVIFLLVSVTSSASSAALISPPQSPGECFNLNGQATLNYDVTEKGWRLVVPLKVTDPTIVIDDAAFTAAWAYSPAPRVLDKQIKYYPPMAINFYYDIEQSMTVPIDRDQADREEAFWQKLFRDAILPKLAEGGSRISKAMSYCNCTCEGTPPTTSLDLNSENRSAWIPSVTYNRMIQAVECSFKDATAGNNAVPNYVWPEPNLWMIFRWHSADEFLQGKKWTDQDMNDWKSQLVNRYPMIGKINTTTQDRVVLIILSRVSKNVSWDAFERKWGDRSRVSVKYLKVPDPVQSDEDFIKQRLTTLNIEIPIAMPLLLDEEQARTGIEIRYPSCDPLTVQIPLSTGKGQEGLMLFTILAQCGVLMFVSFSMFLVSLVCYQQNYGSLRTKLHELVEFPWQNLYEKTQGGQT